MQRFKDIPLQPKVIVLMAVYNGAAHLEAQLESIAKQTYSNWSLVCSDDGSTDNTVEIIKKFSIIHPDKVTLVRGPSKGFAANFMSLISAIHHTDAFICFADQDDVWHPSKISRSIEMLGMRQKPALYCGRRQFWYPLRDQTFLSPKMQRQFSFRNALVENVASGNTIMLNPAAACLGCKAAKQTDSVFAHDWWLYLMVSGVGGHVIFDNGPSMILYRQHEHNAIGAGYGLGAQIRRKYGVLNGVLSGRISQNLHALEQSKDLLDPDCRRRFLAFKAARERRWFERLPALHKVRPYRQHLGGTIGFWGAASLGLI